MQQSLDSSKLFSLCFKNTLPEIKKIGVCFIREFQTDLSIFQSCRMWKLLFNKIDVATTNNKNHCSAIFIESVN